MKIVKPEIHSAEHLLNQNMVKLFNCGRAFSTHLEDKKSKCDYNFERDLTEDEMITIETKVNEVINSDLIVTEEFLSKNEAEKIYNLSRLPDEAGNEVRIVKIGDYDACPCIGQHVKSTKEIGQFKMISHSRENNVLRIRFKVL